MTRATAAAKTASSQRSERMPRLSRRPLPARLVAAHRLQALGDRGHLEAEARRGELLQLLECFGGVLRARIEVALDPALRRAYVLPIARLIARKQRQACIEKPQAEVLAHEICLRRRQQRRLGLVELAHHDELAQLAPDFIR